MAELIIFWLGIVLGFFACAILASGKIGDLEKYIAELHERLYAD